MRAPAHDALPNQDQRAGPATAAVRDHRCAVAPGLAQRLRQAPAPSSAWRFFEPRAAAQPEPASRGGLQGWETAVPALRDDPRLQSDAPTGTAYPRIGEDLAGFRILSELGRGAQGRVYLAAQPALADRPVVLKVTPIRGGEHTSLARLQHTHIVPLLSALDLPARGLRLICLAYLGGTTLDRILLELEAQPVSNRSGRGVLDALARLAGTNPLAVATEGPAREFLASSSYERCVLWMAWCLAEALHHAHRRGLVHLDVKPANVLLADDGMPFLLDFHLARPPLEPGKAQVDWLGGTPGYVAPELKEALEWVARNRAPAQTVDRRADIFALGVVLFEGLSGAKPGHTAPVASQLRRANPRVGAGLADVVAKCLEPDPRRRYADAAALADDLRRLLTDQPLRGVANRSWAERWGRWRRRRPHFVAGCTAVVLAALGAAALAGAAGYTAYRQLGDAEFDLEQGRRYRAGAFYAEAERSLRHGLRRFHTGPRGIMMVMPRAAALRRALTDELGETEQAELTAELHDLTARLRFLHAAPAPSAAARDLERRLADMWKRRRGIQERLRHAGADGRTGDARADLLDVAILWADLHVRLAADTQRGEAVEHAQRILAEAEADWGPSPVFDIERTLHARGTRVSTVTASAGMPLRFANPRDGWERYALGRALLRSGAHEAAFTVLDGTAQAEPRNLWAQFYRGHCAFRTGRFAVALESFGACVALAPTSASCYRNRALAYEALGIADRARDDRARADRLDSGADTGGPRRRPGHIPVPSPRLRGEG